jgi:hypothetical protein
MEKKITAKIEDPIVKTIDIIPTKTLKINNKLTSQQEKKTVRCAENKY